MCFRVQIYRLDIIFEWTGATNKNRSFMCLCVTLDIIIGLAIIPSEYQHKFFRIHNPLLVLYI